MPQLSTETIKKTETLFFVISMLLVFNIAMVSPTDNDIWWHLRSGDEMWHQGKILLQDVTTYTRYGADWVNCYWLSDLGLYGLFKLGGFLAITLTVALIAVLMMAIIYKHMEGSVFLRGLLILLAMIGIHPNWTARPQLMSFLLLAILNYFLDRHRFSKRQPLWILVVILAAWGNLHGGFIWGILLMLAIIAGEGLDNLLDNHPSLNWKEIGQLTLWSFLAGFGVLINPNGIAIWQLPFKQLNASLSIIEEWRSPDFHQFYTHPLLWLLFLLIIGLAYSKKNLSFAELFKGLGFTYLFFVAQRNMGPFAVIVLPIIAQHLEPALQNFSKAQLIETIKNRFAGSQPKPVPPKISSIINIILVSGLAVFAIVNAYFLSTPQSVDAKTPVRAVQWIQENNPPGPIFNSYNWGGYITWTLRQYPVFIDGRTDLYMDGIIDEWYEIYNGTDKGLYYLDTRKINLVFLEPDSPLLSRLPQNEWQKAYSDSMISIYQRKP